MGKWILFTSNNANAVMSCEWLSQIEEYIKKQHKNIEYKFLGSTLLINADGKRYWIEYRKGTIR